MNKPRPGDEVCQECVYHGFISGYTSCDFILVTGKRSGCDPGPKCKRFIKGDPAKRIKYCTANSDFDVPHEKIKELYGVKKKKEYVFPDKVNSSAEPDVLPCSCDLIADMLSDYDMSGREFAEHCGISDGALYRARYRGRITRQDAENIEMATGESVLC